eukprot:2273333-Amphidinium_carterae.1
MKELPQTDQAGQSGVYRNRLNSHPFFLGCRCQRQQRGWLIARLVVERQDRLCTAGGYSRDRQLIPLSLLEDAVEVILFPNLVAGLLAIKALRHRLRVLLGKNRLAYTTECKAHHARACAGCDHCTALRDKFNKLPLTSMGIHEAVLITESAGERIMRPFLPLLI